MPTFPRTSLTPITPPQTPIPNEEGIYDWLRERARMMQTSPQRPGVPSPFLDPSTSNPPFIPEVPQVPVPPAPAPQIPPSPTSLPPPDTSEPPYPTRKAIPTPDYTSLSPMDFGLTKTEGWKGFPYLRPGDSPAPTAPPVSTPPPISFAWGGGAPQEYVPGETDISQFAGAPDRSTFMGGAGTPGRGTFTALNPPAVRDTGDLYQDLERQRLEENLALSQRSARDPLWAEREQADIWRRSQVGAQEEIAAAADKRIAETFATARERLRQSPEYLNPQNPDGSPVRDPETARRDMEAALDQQEDAARMAVLGSAGRGGSAVRMPNAIFSR